MATPENVQTALHAMFPGAWNSTTEDSRRFWEARMARALDAVAEAAVPDKAPWSDPRFVANVSATYAGISEPVAYDAFKEFVDLTYSADESWDTSLAKARGWARLAADVGV